MWVHFPYKQKKMGLTSQATADKSQRWWHLSSIQLAGGIISVPILSIGSAIFYAHGIGNAILSILLGNAFVYLLSLLMIAMSSNMRLNAVENASQFIGKPASRFFAFLILITMTGWTALQLSSGTKFLQFYPFLTNLSTGSVAGVLASLILLFGIRGLKTLSLIAILPLLFSLIMTVLLLDPSEKHLSATLDHNLFELSGLSFVISGGVSAIADFPTFFRHSKSKTDSFIALTLSFLVIVSIQLIGVSLAQIFIFDKDSLYKLISENTMGSFSLASFIFISMIGSACWNIYATSVGWESLFPIFKDRTEYAVIGLVATVLMNYNIMTESFVYLTTFFDTMISALIGVMVVSFLYHREKDHILLPNASWLIATCIGLAAYFNIFLSRKMCIFTSLIAGLLITTLLFGIKRLSTKH